MVLPNPGKVAPEAAIPEPPPGHEWIYPYSVAPHYHSQNAGPWWVLLQSDASLRMCSPGQTKQIVFEGVIWLTWHACGVMPTVHG